MFDPDEYCQRLGRLRKNLIASELEALIVCSDYNIAYLCGVFCETGDRRVLLVIPAKGAPSLIVPRMEKEIMEAAVTVDDVQVYWEKDAKPGRGWEDTLQKVLGSAQKIGLDPHAVMEVVGALAGRECQVSELVEDLRVIKSPAEIAITRRAAQFWTKAMDAMFKIAEVGLPVSELISVGGAIVTEIFSSEPHANRSNTYANQFFQCSPGSSSPHYTSRPDELLPNGPSILNVIGSVCGYNAENERTILTGDYTAEHADLFDITHNAHKLALSLIKPGAFCSEVDCAVQEFFTEQGLADAMRHRVGHGFGLVYHERPYTSEGSGERYEPGMLISVEPGIYVEGVGGVRHSDTVLIKKGGIENFTASTPIDRVSLTF